MTVSFLMVEYMSESWAISQSFAQQGTMLWPGKRGRLFAHMDFDCLRAVVVQEGGEAADKPGGKPTKWANPILQKRAWSNAWLALLALPLPEGILRKVTLPFPHCNAHASLCKY